MARFGVRRWAAGLVSAAGVAVILTMVGCGAQPERAIHSSADSAAGAPGQAVGEAAGQPNAPGPGLATDPRVDQRAIIYTGSISVRVDNVSRAAIRTASIVTTVGGFVGGEQRNEENDAVTASMQLRVPAEKFASVLDEIAGLGHPLQREVKTEDVTEETVDLDARIASQRARVESGRRLLAQARSLADLVMLEGELAKREADLASMEARKRRLNDLTALSTITVTLFGPEVRKSVEKPRSGFLAGLTAGWAAFVASMRVLLTVLGALLPWIVALGVPLLGVRWLLGRFRRSRRNRPGPPAAPPGPPPAAPAGPPGPPPAASPGPPGPTPPAAQAAPPAPRPAPPAS